MVADRLGVEDQAAGDRLVVEALGDQLEDVELALGERREILVAGGTTSGLGQLAHGLGQLLVEHDLATGDRPQRPLHALGPRALHEVAASAVAQRGQQRVVVFGHREQDHLDVGMALDQQPVDLQARAVGEADVEEHDVGPGRLHEGRDVLHPFRLADELDPIHLGQRGGEAEAEQRVIVDDEHAQRLGSGRHGNTAGRRTCRWVPCGRCGPRVTLPPSSAARSRMAASPTPLPMPPPLRLSRPTPSSTTSISTTSRASMRSQQVAAWACRTTLVSASVTMR